MRGAKRRQAAAARPCRVYWGSHGCKKVRGHTGIHICGCGELPYYLQPNSGITEDQMGWYGEDIELYGLRPRGSAGVGDRDQP